MFTVLCGHRELGKSTLAYWLTRQRPRRLIWDPRCLWRSGPGRLVYGVRGDRALSTWSDVATAWAQAPELVIQPDDVAEDWLSLTADLRAYLLQHPNAEWSFLVDEYGLTLQELPDRQAQNDFNFLARCAPRADVDFYVTCHKPVDVPARIRSIVDTWALFRIVEQNDLDMVTGWCGRTALELRAMPPYVCWWWDHSRGQGRLVTQSERWHVALTPTPRAPSELATLLQRRR